MPSMEQRHLSEYRRNPADNAAKHSAADLLNITGTTTTRNDDNDYDYKHHHDDTYPEYYYYYYEDYDENHAQKAVHSTGHSSLRPSTDKPPANKART